MAVLSVTFSTAIMAHPARRRLVRQLARQLDRPPVAWDQHQDRWDTGRRALLAHDPRAEYHLVVQDDAIVPDGFKVGVANALARVPTGSPLVLYSTRTRQWAPVLNRVRSDASFLVMSRIWWGVGVVVPTSAISDLVAWCDEGNQPHYDHRLGSYFESRGIDCWYTWPNLVDHRHVASLIEGRSSRRSAHRFVEGRADRLTWDGPVVRVKPPRSIKTPPR